MYVVCRIDYLVTVVQFPRAYVLARYWIGAEDFILSFYWAPVTWPILPLLLLSKSKQQQPGYQLFLFISCRDIGSIELCGENAL